MIFFIAILDYQTFYIMNEQLLALIYWRISIVWTCWTFRSELPQLGPDALDRIQRRGVVIHQMRPC